MSENTNSVVVDTSAGPNAWLKPVPLTAVKLTDRFWAPRIRINRDVTVPSQYRYLEETGRLDNFRRAARKVDRPFEGIYFNDSDVYKWLEAASWVLASDPNAEAQGRRLAEVVDNVIAEVEGAQGPDGYLDTYFTFEREAERWTNLRDLHELYCAGHLIQAAVAHHRATAKTSLLRVACSVADHICSVFGPEEAGKRPGTGGHEEVELALVELARDTGHERYLQQAQFFVDVRGQGYAGGDAYHQDHLPFRDLEQMVGHAVRAVYLNAGAADVYAETGDATLLVALERMWERMTTRQMYISGGIGARYQGEAFGADYELPNGRAYAETCAAIGSVMWSWRMLALEGDARYADLIERTLYNAVLVGLSLDGQSYFYQNPLASDGAHRRQPWFGCACCPPNVARTLAALPGYFYSQSDEGIWVHLYAEGRAALSLPDGREVSLTQYTDYPWDGGVRIEVDGEGEFVLCLRVPGWCEESASLQVNGTLAEGPLVSGSYVQIRRAWQVGDVVELDLPMPVRRIEAHPYVAENAGRVALMRGPLLYCLEQVDLGLTAGQTADLRDVVLPASAPFSVRHEPDLLGGVSVLEAEAMVLPPEGGWAWRLYRAACPHSAPSYGEAVQIRAVPYYAWANREAGAMQVWLRTE